MRLVTISYNFVQQLFVSRHDCRYCEFRPIARTARPARIAAVLRRCNDRDYDPCPALGGHTRPGRGRHPDRATHAASHARPRGRRDTRYEGLRRHQPPECRHRRPRRMRQDTAGLHHAVRGGRGQPHRPRRRRNDHHRLRRRRNRPQAHPLLQPRLRRVAESQNQHHRHTGIRQLPDRRARRAPRRGSRARRRRCRRGRRSADREALGRSRRPRPAAHRRAQPARSRPRQPRALTRVAPPRLRPRDRPDSAAPGRGEGVHRRRRPGPHEGADVRRRRQDDRGRDPELAGRRRAARARAAHRDGRRSRRTADGNLLRRRHAHAGAARRRAAHGDDGRQDLPAAVHVRPACDGDPAAARRDRELRAVAGRTRLPRRPIARAPRPR